MVGTTTVVCSIMMFLTFFILSSARLSPSSEVLHELVLTSEYSEGTALIGLGGFLGGLDVAIMAEVLAVEGVKTRVELQEDSGESPRPESKLGEAPWGLMARILLLLVELVDEEDEEALAATMETLSRFSKSTSSSSDSVSESP